MFSYVKMAGKVIVPIHIKPRQLLNELSEQGLHIILSACIVDFLLQGLSEPEFNGDLVYKFRKIIGRNDFPDHVKKIIVRYKKIGYNIDALRQTACLVVHPVKVALLTFSIARR